MVNIGVMKLLGLLFSIFSLAVLFNFDVFRKVIRELQKFYVLEILLSVFRVILGLIILIFFNFWSGPFLLISFVGLLSLGSGVIGLFFPQQIMYAIPMITKHAVTLKFILVILLSLGLAMTYFGFFG